jgi:AraC-like DNA-binding protein
VYFPGSFIGYMQYGAPTAVAVKRERPDYWVQIPIRGHVEAVVGELSVMCDSRRGVVLSPLRGNLMRSEAESARLSLSITASALARQLAALNGEPLRDLPELEPVLDLSSGYGLSLARYVKLAVADFEAAGGVSWNDLTMSLFEQFILTRLLLSHPHNHSAALQRANRRVLPRDVKRATEFIDANFESPIGLPEIVAACGVPGRTLLQHFRDAQGSSPMRYLRDVRFRKAQATLQRAAPGANVTEIAARFGFSHLGRFSVEYHRRFGEVPSETLRRGRVKR